MKIAAPISSVREAEMLLHYGADELYCGVRTPEWDAHFGEHLWMNRRSPGGANLGSWEEIRQMVNLAHGSQIPVHVTLNAPFYTQAGVEYLLKLAEKLTDELHIDSLIVSDLTFLMRLSRRKLPVNLHLSSLGSCINSHTADFYHTMGIKRIILPRQLRLSEIKRIVRQTKSPMEFEVFAVNDGCFFEEGFCQTTHALGGPFCLTDWEVQVRPVDDRPVLKAHLGKHFEDLREYLWYQNNCGSSFQQDGLPNGPCSLCWFGHFRDWGITAVKIVGREASFYRKMRSLQLVKAVMVEIDKGVGRQEIAQFARSLRATPQYCDKGYMCYFKDR
jgi:putative protease